MTDSARKESEKLLRFVSPKFILCLRDFFFDFEDPDSDVSSLKEYFESTIKEKKEQGDKTSNRTKTCIRNFFPEYDCFALDRPVSGRRLRDLSTIPSRDLDQEFKQNVRLLRQSVYNSQPKNLVSLFKTPINGSEFVCLVECFVGAIQRKETIDFEQAYYAMAFEHNRKVTKDVLKTFTGEMDSERLPVKMKSILQAKYENLKSKTIEKYRHLAYPYLPDEFEDELLNVMLHILQDRLTENRTILQERCVEKLMQLYKKMMEEHSQKYRADFEQYREDVKNLEAHFAQITKDIDTEEVVAALAVFRAKVKEDSKQFYRGRSYTTRIENEFTTHCETQAPFNSYTKTDKIARDKYYEVEAEKMAKLLAEHEALKDELERLKSRRCVVM